MQIYYYYYHYYILNDGRFLRSPLLLLFLPNILPSACKYNEKLFFVYHQINIINYTKKCLNAFFCSLKRKEKSCTFETLLTPNLRLIGNARSNWAERASRSSDWNANETPA